MERYQPLDALLVRLEGELTQLGYWQENLPLDDALASTAPFSIDTLDCTEWLQWVFIPKMRHYMGQKMPLPLPFAISPYVEEAFKGMKGKDVIAPLSREIDALLNDSLNVIPRK